MTRVKYILCGLLAGFVSLTATANDTDVKGAGSGEVIGIPVMPQRGMTTDQVVRIYGTPEHKSAAVGEPPISRWYYDGFIVYFEHRYVIHALATENGQ